HASGADQRPRNRRGDSGELAVAAGVLTLGVIATGWAIESHAADAQLAGIAPSVPWSLVGPGCVVAGPLLAILSLLLVNRHILREAEGKAAVRKPKATAAKPAKAKKAATKPTDPSADAPAKPARTSSKSTKPEAAEPAATAKPTIWTNGDDDYAEDYDEDQPKRRLSKAERKRLRRQKARNAA
ncbi:MAG: hypothetical protein AAFV43_07035, partial [Planctomycetota bacterium]